MRMIVYDRKDPGEIVANSQVVQNVKFSRCVLSMTGADSRSMFRGCEFKNIRLDNCVVGHPIFEKCKFENVVSNGTITLYDSLFLECCLVGKIKNLNFGKIRLAVPFFSENRFLQDVSRMEECAFSIDITGVTDMDECAFIGDLLAQKIIFKKGQGFLLKGEQLDLVLGSFLKETPDFDLAVVLSGAVGFGALYGLHFCAIPSRLANKAGEYAAVVRSFGVDVYEESLV